MKVVKYGLLGIFVVAAIAVMPLPVIASEDAELPAELKELEEVNAAMGEYVATLSPEDRAAFYRAVGEIEKEYDDLDDLEDEEDESIQSGDGSEDAGIEAIVKQLEEANAAIDEYVATLSPEDQAEFYRTVGEIEKEYDSRQALDDEDDESIESGDESGD